MGLEFITRVIKVTLILAAVSLLAVSVYYGFGFGLAIFLGSLWGCVNLFFIKLLVQEFITAEKRDYLKIWTILGIKFPILYLAGFGLLQVDYLPALNLALGFSLIPAVVFLKGLGRLILEKTRPQGDSRPV